MDKLARNMLDLIEKYEEIPRAALAMNVRYAMKELGLTERGECIWLANLFKTTRNTTYSWFAPNRESKVPLKVVLTISLSLDVPLDKLLDSSVRVTREQLRIGKERISYKEAVFECADAHPDWSLKEIALNLEIDEDTVRRHLNIRNELNGDKQGGKK